MLHDIISKPISGKAIDFPQGTCVYSTFTVCIIIVLIILTDLTALIPKS